MTTSQHYDEARARAQEIREKYGLDSPRVMVSDLKRIYSAEGIDKVDYWGHFKGTRIKGAYFSDGTGCTVVINKKIIKQIDPKVFTMGHELKHHLMDEVHGISLCSTTNENITLERGADVFAAELIFPAELFDDHMLQRSIARGCCTAEHIVQVKHETQTTLSHQGLAIRAYRQNYAIQDAFKEVKWNLLRDRMYPEYLRFRQPRRFRSVV
jgi:Zn-dependent peptidase ImmA (M78 family)